jgi:predicted permease
MKWLLNLYPPAWRRRYRRELEAYLELEPATLRTALDLISGAIDARLNSSWIPEMETGGDAQPRVAVVRNRARRGDLTMSNVRAAAQQIRRHPGFSAVVVVMLALGIGATTAIFSLFHQILLQRLPVPQAGELVNFSSPGTKWGSNSCGTAGNCDEVFSYPMFRDLERQQTVFTGIAAHRDFGANLSYDGRNRLAGGMLVSGDYFEVLQLRPALGRLIDARDEPALDESRVVVLSYDYWQSDLGGDPNVLGTTLRVSGESLTIIGVAPEGFSGTTTGLRPRVYVPLTMRWLVQPGAPRHHAEERRAYWLYLFARPNDGVSLEQAGAAINALYGAIVNEIEAPLNANMPPNTLEEFKQRRINLAPGARGQSSLPSTYGRPLALLLGLTAAVLLIACVNVANLFLARGTSRTGEMAIRSALGASRSRLIAQLLTEAAILAALGGIASVPVAAATVGLIGTMMPAPVASTLSMSLSPASLAFATVVTLTTVLAFGLSPALRLTRATAASMKGHAAQSIAGRGLVRVRATLATAQIAFSMVLLVLAGLFAQSLTNIARVDLGLDVDSLVTFSVRPMLSGYSAERARTVFDRIHQEVAAEPGVTSVASATIPVMTNSNWTSTLAIEGVDGGPGVDTNASQNDVSPGYFGTFSIPLVVGRDFDDRDRLGSPQVAIVNESFVRRFDLGGDVVGKRLGNDGPAGELDIEIVGVVADAKYSNVKAPTPPQFFMPHSQSANLGGLTFYVRAALEPDALASTIRRVVSGIDPDLPIGEVVAMRRVVQGNVFLDRLVAALSSGFAVLATALAAIGLYGVLAYSVAQRTREFGLRFALGARSGQLRGMVLKQVAAIAVVGVSIGLVAALALGRVAETLLFGLSGYEPLVFAAAAVVLSLVAFAASFLPAYRASKVQPMEALRYQ